MKKDNHENIIGLIGGTSWVSTAEYYHMINEKANEKLGGLNFARCILYSLNYGDINELNGRNDLNGVYLLLLDAAKQMGQARLHLDVTSIIALHVFWRWSWQMPQL